MASLLSQIFSCWSTPLAQAMSDDPVVPARPPVLPKEQPRDAIYPASVIPAPTKQPRPAANTSAVSPPASRHTASAPASAVPLSASAAAATHHVAAASSAASPVAADWDDDWGDDDDDGAAPSSPPATTAVTTMPVPAEREAPVSRIEAAVVAAPSPSASTTVEHDDLPPITIASLSSSATPYTPPSINGTSHGGEEDDDGDFAERALRKKSADIQTAPEPEPEIDYFADMAPTVTPAKRIVVEPSLVVPKQTRVEVAPKQSSQTLALAADADDLDEIPSWGDDDIDSRDLKVKGDRRASNTAAPKEKKEKRLGAVREKLNAAAFE